MSLPRGRLSDLSQQSIQRLACLRGQSLQSAVLRWLQIVQVTSHLQDCFDLRERPPGGIEKTPVLPRPPLCTPLGDVERHAIARPPQLAGEDFLLALREASSALDTLDSQTLRMLPCLQSAVWWHTASLADRDTGHGIEFPRTVPPYSLPTSNRYPSRRLSV